MKTTRLLLLSTFLSLSAVRAEDSVAQPSDSPIGALGLAEVARAALADNPEVKAAYARWLMLRERVPQAKAWEDLAVGVDVERFGTSRFRDYTDAEWMVMQEIPISGKNHSRARIADAEALAVLEEFRRATLDTVAEARAAYFSLANAHEQLAVNQRNIDLLKQFMEISRARYEAGTRMQADVLLAETELVKALELKVDLRRALSDAQTRLNVAMNREPHAALGRPALEFTRYAPDSGRLRALALAHRPEVQMAGRKVEAQEAALQLAKRQWIPDPQIRVEGRSFRDDGRSGIREYDTGLFFSIPWGNARKYEAGEREARAGIEMAGRDLEAVRSRALGLIRDQIQKIETFRHHYELFRDRLVPIARQTTEATLAGYETDKAGFLDLIAAQKSLQDVESTWSMHLAEYQTSLAELEAIVGLDLHIFPTPIAQERTK